MGARPRIKGFDGIRGLAAIAVVLQHSWIAGRNLGSIAVDAFFVLSGFLICGILHSARERVDAAKSTFKTELFHFWANRGLRIFPLYYVVLISVAAGGVVTGTFQSVISYFVWYALYLQNLLLVPINDSSGSIGHTWTLAVEQQFYVLFGALLLLVPARRHTIFLLLTLSLCFGGAEWALVAIPSPAKYTMPFAGFVAIVTGGLARLAYDRFFSQPKANSALTLVYCGVLIVVALLHENPAFDIATLSAASIFSAVLLVEIMRNQSGIVTRVLDIAALRWLGALSYGIYIIHGVVRQVTQVSFQMYASPKTFVVVLIATLILAQASRTFIELPALKMKYRMKA